MAEKLGYTNDNRNIKSLKRHAQLFRRKLLIVGAVEIQVLSSGIMNCFHMVNLLVTYQRVFFKLHTCEPYLLC